MPQSPKNLLDEVFIKSIAEKRILSSEGPLESDDLKDFQTNWRSFPIRPREAIGLCMENGRDCLLAYLTLASRDAVASPLSPDIPLQERVRLWKELGCQFYLDEKGFHSLSEEEPLIWPEDIYWVMHSSGSTGIPKAIPLTLTALQQNAEDVMTILGGSDQNLHLGSMSMCYTNGLYNSFLLPLLTGEKIFLGPVATALRFKIFMEIMNSCSPTWVWVNPTVLKFMIRQAKPRQVAQSKALISCTAPLSKDDCLIAEKKFGIPVLQSYGLTETLIVSLEQPRRNAEKNFSAGIIVGGTDSVRLTQNNTLIIQNKAVSPGYVYREGAHLQLKLENGTPGSIFESGDLAELCRDGRLKITGRKTNVINISGAKISPEQIEEVLIGFSKVENVVVIGLPDQAGIEHPVALIQSSSSPDVNAMAEACVKRLGTKARPSSILIVDKIPNTENGKVDRVKAKELLTGPSSSFHPKILL